MDAAKLAALKAEFGDDEDKGRRQSASRPHAKEPPSKKPKLSFTPKDVDGDLGKSIMELFFHA